MTAAAIRWLAPWLLGYQVTAYAGAIDREAVRSHVDPLLVVALVHRESRWDPNAVSGRNMGLGQVRVSRTTNPHLLRRPWVLLHPATNIRYTVRALAQWRSYHRRHCVTRMGASSGHQWLLLRASSGGIRRKATAHPAACRSRRGVPRCPSRRNSRTAAVRATQTPWPSLQPNTQQTFADLGFVGHISLAPEHTSPFSARGTSPRSHASTLGFSGCTSRGSRRSLRAASCSCARCSPRVCSRATRRDDRGCIACTKAFAKTAPLNCGESFSKVLSGRTSRMSFPCVHGSITVKHEHRKHEWFAHYQWGARVTDPGSGRRVMRLYRRLRRRFHRRPSS